MNKPAYESLGITEERVHDLHQRIQDHIDTAREENDPKERTDISYTLGLIVADASVSDLERHYMCFHLGFHVGVMANPDDVVKIK